MLHLTSFPRMKKQNELSLVYACAGDTLEVFEYERLLPLKAEKAALGTLEGVRKGDCLVAFSRRGCTPPSVRLRPGAPCAAASSTAPSRAKRARSRHVHLSMSNL